MIPSNFVSAAEEFLTRATTKIPPAGKVVSGDFSSAGEVLFFEAWTMGQAWRDDVQEGFRPATVRLGWQPEALWVLADLADDHIVSDSTDHNQDLWTLGDVFEVFIARRDSPWYLELHVTPHNHRLHLRWTEEDFAGIRAKEKTLDDFRADPGAFESWARQSPDGKGWQVLMRIPASILPGGENFSAGGGLDMSFSRYDVGAEGTPVILSSTSPHTRLDYHRRSEWRSVELVAGRTC
jgi:hypothetical protein